MKDRRCGGCRHEKSHVRLEVAPAVPRVHPETNHCRWYTVSTKRLSSVTNNVENEASGYSDACLLRPDWAGCKGQHRVIQDPVKRSDLGLTAPIQSDKIHSGAFPGNSRELPSWCPRAPPSVHPPHILYCLSVGRPTPNVQRSRGPFLPPPRPTPVFSGGQQKHDRFEGLTPTLS